MTPEDLVEFELIRQLKYRYMRALDSHDWDLMETCVTDDVTADYDEGNTAHQGVGSFKRSGRNDLIGFLQSIFVPSMASSHTAHHPEIELLDPDRARAIWRLEDVLHYLAENPVIPIPADQIWGSAYYYDEYVKLDGDWKIKHTGYVRIFEEGRPRWVGAATAPSVVSTTATLGRRPGGWLSPRP